MRRTLIGCALLVLGCATTGTRLTSDELQQFHCRCGVGPVGAEAMTQRCEMLWQPDGRGDLRSIDGEPLFHGTLRLQSAAPDGFAATLHIDCSQAHCGERQLIFQRTADLSFQSPLERRRVSPTGGEVSEGRLYMRMVCHR